MAVLAALSWQFPYGTDPATAPVLTYVAVAMLAGAGLIIAACLLPKVGGVRHLLLGVFLIGFLMRGAMFLSLPVMEDDSYRYFWDGAVVARGLDPYAIAPADASGVHVFGDEAATADDPATAPYRDIADAYPVAYERINFPYVSTIYPPLTQAAFALAHVIEPFGMTGWRSVLLGVDLVSFILLLAVLKAFGRARVWAVIYWWNPVVIVQGLGAGHMDLLLVPFLLGAVILLKRGKTGWSTLALAGAAGVKLWPLLLFPVFARPLLRTPMRLVVVALAFTALTALLLVPQLQQALSPDAGLNAYSSSWRRHAFLFGLLEDGVFAWLDDPGPVSRVVIGVSLICLTGYLALFKANKAENVPWVLTMIISAFLFLSPTGYPWYLIWLLPFLCLTPNIGLISLTVTAPLYWLRFAIGDDAPVYTYLVIPAAFLPPLAISIWTMRRKVDAHAVRCHHTCAE